MLNSPIRLPHPLRIGRVVQLDQAAVEALRFRELQVSEACTVQGPDGAYFRARICSLGTKGGEALPYEQLEIPPESSLELTLLCAVLNRQRMLQVIQKATELGVSRVVPIFTACSVGPDGLEHEKAHAWPKQALRAARQCRRAAIPEVLPATPLTEALAAETWRKAACRLMMDDRPADPAAPATRPPRLIRGPASAALAVGPEGGWSEEERLQLLEAGAVPFRLGGRVLRAETAVVVGLTLVQHRLGDLHP